MASGAENRRPTAGGVASVGACLVSAALFAFGTGLHPVWWLTWFAPVPVLLLAPRVSARRAALVAALAYLLGMIGYLRYLLGVLQIPVGLAAGLVLVTVGVFTGVTLLFRVVLVRGRVLLAVLSAPAAWAGAEYLLAILSPSGSNWALANTQADDLPVLQVVSLTGPWGVAFVLITAATAAAAAAAPTMTWSARVRAGLAGVLVLAATLSYGGTHLAGTPTESVKVSLAVAPVAHRHPHAATPAGRALVRADLAEVDHLPSGVRLVVFPEKDLVVTEATLPDVSARFAAAARTSGATLVLGVERHTGRAVYNTALAFPPDRPTPVRYDKHYPLPGVESNITPGTRLATAPGFHGHVGIVVCADLGQVSLGRAYGRAGAGLLAAPALDFDVDAWSQSRVQFMRGVENGYSIARAARQGYLTLSDGHGRVFAQAPTTHGQGAVVTANLPVTPGGTPYTFLGDWFAWLCLALTAIALATLRRPARPRVTHQAR